MPTVTDFLTPKDLSQSAVLQLLARQVMEGFCSGLHKSPHKGFSVEFKEHRQYVPGDEIRSIDWKLFGKTDRLYIREYEEETNLRCNILLDKSGSMAYEGSRAGGLSKHEYAVRLAACLTFLMLGQQDAVGLVNFDDQVRRVIPPKSKPTHLTAIIDELAQLKPERETELANVFHQLVPKIRRRALLVIISDCFGDTDEILRSLAHFRHAKHEIIIFQVWDRDELDFPFRQWTQFQSLEQKSNRRLIDPAHLRKIYLKNLEEFRERLTSGCRRHRVDLVPVVTDQPYAEALAAYLAARRRMR